MKQFVFAEQLWKINGQINHRANDRERRWSICQPLSVNYYFLCEVIITEVSANCAFYVNKADFMIFLLLFRNRH